MDEKDHKRLLSTAIQGAILYTDALLSTGKKQYFNSTLGSSIRNIRYTFEQMKYDVSQEDEKITRYVFELMLDIQDTLANSSAKRFENEAELIDLFKSLGAEYVSYCRQTRRSAELTNFFGSESDRAPSQDRISDDEALERAEEMIWRGMEKYENDYSGMRMG